MSIAVLRTFISQRKLEHDAMLARRTKAGNKAPNAKVENPGDSVQHNGESTDGSEVLKDASHGESSSIPVEQNKNLRGKGREELKPPRVLEVYWPVLLIIKRLSKMRLLLWLTNIFSFNVT